MKKLLLICLLFQATLAIAQTKENLINKDSLDIIFNKIIDHNGPGTGILLLGKNNTVLYKNGFGYADLESKRKVDENTQFNIASISKSLTALAIMQLVEKGLLSVNDTLGKFFPGLPKGDKITIHQLLTHTSGISNTGNVNHWFEKAGMNEVQDSTDEQNTFKDFISVIAEGYLNTDGIFDILREYPEFNFEPGEEGKWEYCNRGYNVLAKIVEKVSGRDFRDYMRENVFVPIGMMHTYVHTGLLERETEINNYAASYVYENNKWRKLFNLIPGGAGDGNVYTTINDWVLYEKCLNGEMPAVISQKSLNEIFNNQVKVIRSFKTPEYYGYGWFIYELKNGQRDIWHTGGNIGVWCLRYYSYNDELNMVIFSTQDNLKRINGRLRQYLIRNGIIPK